MTTAFLALSTAITDALRPVVSTRVGNVLRGRRVSLAQGQTQGLRINSVQHAAKPLDLAGAHLQWETTLVVGILARATSDSDAEATLDPLLAAVWQALAALTASPPAGCFGIVLDPQIGIDLDEADQTVTVASLALRITHITDGATLVAAS